MLGVLTTIHVCYHLRTKYVTWFPGRSQKFSTTICQFMEVWSYCKRLNTSLLTGGIPEHDFKRRLVYHHVHIVSLKRSELEVLRRHAARNTHNQAIFANAGISHHGEFEALHPHAFCRLVSTRVFIHHATNEVIA